MNNIFQITAQDLIYHTDLDESDINLWAYLVCGCYHIFDTKQEAEQSYKEVFVKHPLKLYHPPTPRYRAVGRNR